MRRKKSSLTTTIIIILVIIVGVIFGYIYIQDKELDRKATSTTEEKTTKKEKKVEEEKEISIEEEIVKKIEEDTKKIGAYNKYHDFDVNNVSKYNLIETAINGLDNSQITYCISNRNQIKATITIDDLNNSLDKYVKDAKLTIDDLRENSGETSLTVKDYGYGSFAIVMDGDNIHVIGSCDGPGLLRENIEVSTVKATTKGDNLYLYKKIAYGRLGSNNQGLTYTYYKNPDRTEEIETVSINNAPTWENYDTYISTYEKQNDTYYLISSKKAE